MSRFTVTCAAATLRGTALPCCIAMVQEMVATAVRWLAKKLGSMTDASISEKMKVFSKWFSCFGTKKFLVAFASADQRAAANEAALQLEVPHLDEQARKKRKQPAAAAPQEQEYTPARMTAWLEKAETMCPLCAEPFTEICCNCQDKLGCHPKCAAILTKRTAVASVCARACSHACCACARMLRVCALGALPLRTEILCPTILSLSVAAYCVQVLDEVTHDRGEGSREREGQGQGKTSC